MKITRSILQLLIVIIVFSTSTIISAQQANTLKVEPPFWWEAMEYNNIEILLYAKNINQLKVEISKKGILVNNISSAENPNYVFIDITISDKVKDGFFIILKDNLGDEKYNYWYALKQRKSDSKNRVGFNSSDVIYLIMPDRFANGNSNNDDFTNMLEKHNRSASLGRHGGDLQGIRNNLNYISEMGFTALWLNPVFENNMPNLSYHGYAITDFYKIDPRLGSNQDYIDLISDCHRSNLKVIKDMVFNHVGSENWLIKDLPENNWVNQWEEFTRSNYHGEVNNDIYASDFDIKQMGKGWFDTTMPDLNQSNPQVLKYLTQNSIWWIENADLDGIRMDTYPYPDKTAMAEWAKVIKRIYPNFTIVGESWLNFPAHVAYWQEDANTPDGYNSYISSITDFPTYYATKKAFSEEEAWSEGLSRLYFNISQDFLYANPQNLVVFPDNHDTERFATSIDGDINKYKLAIAFYLTTRGIPQIYYGTEIMMDSRPYTDHGSWRRDFPGGWEGDKKNAFTNIGLSQKEIEAKNYMQIILNWRKNKDVIHSGNYKHFIPQNNTYVYCRYTKNASVLIILNKNKQEFKLDLTRYQECIEGYSSATDIIRGEKISILQEIILNPMSAYILELEK